MYLNVLTVNMVRFTVPYLKGRLLKTWQPANHRVAAYSEVKQQCMKKVNICSHQQITRCW